MKIIRNYIERKTLKEFAEENDLTLVVSENYDGKMFTAYFDKCCIEDSNANNCFYKSGLTEYWAIKSLCEAISHKKLVLKQVSGENKTIEVPMLAFDSDCLLPEQP